MQLINDWPKRAAQAKWGVAILAKETGVSLSTLNRYFLKVMRQSPREWVNGFRMREARELLVNGGPLSIKEICKLLGYASQHHFSFAFKKHHGYPPSLHWQKAESRKQKTENRKQKTENRKQMPDAGIMPCMMTI